MYIFFLLLSSQNESLKQQLWHKWTKCLQENQEKLFNSLKYQFKNEISLIQRNMPIIKLKSSKVIPQ